MTNPFGSEEERLRNALHLTMDRLYDLAEIAREKPWSAYPLAESFLHGSAERVLNVLANGACYHDDVPSPVVAGKAAILRWEGKK